MTLFRKYYAQNREDIILEGFFTGRAEGFYVDIGANHPTIDSVTKLFYDKGWTGINVEPNKGLYDLLAVSRPRDTNLQIGVSDKAGTLTIREYPDGNGFSTFSKEMQYAYAKNPSIFTKNYKDYEVEVATLAQIFTKQKVPAIDFMKVDVEGFEYEVLDSNDWKKYRPKVICIEANHIEKDWRPLLEKADYSLVFFDGLNNYYVAKEWPKIAQEFSYVNTVLINKTPVYAEFYDAVEDNNERAAHEQRRIARLELNLEDLNNQLIQSRQQMAQMLRLRSLIKHLGRAIDAIVLLHIEKLNKPRVLHSKPLSINSGATKQQQITAIQAYDFTRYYGLKTSLPLSYRIAYGTYFRLSRAIFKAARGTIRILRKARHSGTK